jgi:hypothetical protein
MGKLTDPPCPYRQPQRVELGGTNTVFATVRGTTEVLKQGTLEVLFCFDGALFTYCTYGWGAPRGLVLNLLCDLLRSN